ncbi:MAG: hypothetical protein EOM41_08115 [Bacilli bacterium]|nr:hypothetical protein [Bacilli bacterium]
MEAKDIEAAKRTVGNIGMFSAMYRSRYTKKRAANNTSEVDYVRYGVALTKEAEELNEQYDQAKSTYNSKLDEFFASDAVKKILGFDEGPLEGETAQDFETYKQLLRSAITRRMLNKLKGELKDRYEYL